MNIFYLHDDPRVCAEQQVDKHVVKMILEYAQLLSTAHRVLDGELYIAKTKTGRKAKRYRLKDDSLERQLYKATHINHKSAVWCRETDSNYKWLYDLWISTMDEYTYRYGRRHESEKLRVALSKLPKNIMRGPFTPPPPAMPDEYKVEGDSLESYHNYYRGDKKRMHSWKKRKAPDWINTIESSEFAVSS